MRLLFIFIVTLSFSSCQNEKTTAGSFILKNAPTIGIDFQNKIIDLPKHNALVYETFYSGAGVAVGDINNDGLIDIYFAGNQVADVLYLNKGNWQFEDVTLQSGIRNNGSWSSGVTMADVNGDGWLDIYVCNTLYDERPELRKNQLYINQRDGKFLEKAESYGLADLWRSQEACFFDYDRDGDQDLLLINQPPNPGILSPLKGVEYRIPELGPRLYENTKNKFTDVSEQLGLAHVGFALSASIADLNDDGWMDIYISHDYNAPDKLYINQKGEKFVNTIDESCEQISFFSMGTDIADVNNDAQNDIVVLDMVSSDPYRNKANMGGMNPEAFWKVVNNGGHYQYMYNSLQLNEFTEEGTPYFSNIAQLAGMSSTDWSWSPLIADFDNDGFKDIFISNGIKKDLRFTDGLNFIRDTLSRIKRNKSLTQETLLDNVDFKPLLDKLPSSKISNFVFNNKNGLNFENKAKEWNLDQPSFSHGAAVADLDNDGDLDLIVSNNDDAPFIYENQLSNNNYLRVKLLNKSHQKQSPIGASIMAYKDNEIITGNVGSNRGYYSCSEDVIHLGLGDWSDIDSLIVNWGGGQISRHSEIPINDEVLILKTQVELRAYKSSSKSEISNLADERGLKYQHDENGFDDYDKQVLLPYKIGVNDVPILVEDFNGDKIKDIMIGSSLKNKNQIYWGSSDGQFGKKETFGKDSDRESTDLIAFDIENDGDIDFYEVNGGNEKSAGSDFYKNQFYINNGQAEFNLLQDDFSNEQTSDAAVELIDANNDGLMDLLIAARHIPGQYPFSPNSKILINQSSQDEIKFSDQTDKLLPDFEKLGMLTDILVLDIDNDQDDDIITVGEWMPITLFENRDGEFVKSEIPNTHGWWMCISETDYNRDGLPDFLVGNLGDNAKYKKNKKVGFSVFFEDLDENGNSDIILSYDKGNKQFPVRGRSCSSEQMPELAEKFPTYHQFASASLGDIYGSNLSETSSFQIDEFSSILLKNKGTLNFELEVLPEQLQVSALNEFTDIGDNTFLSVGNLNEMEIETPNVDASSGSLFKISMEGKIEIINPSVASAFKGQINKVHKIKIGEDHFLMYIPINEKLQLIPVSSLLP